MTLLPYLDIKATPIHSVELPQPARRQSLPRIVDGNGSTCSSKASSIRSSRIPKIKIIPRTDEILKQLPCPKPSGACKHNAIWKPFTRELPDYDYLWESLRREDIRHQYDHYIAPARVTASLPEPPKKMSTAYESQERHYHNYQRTLAMQQRQWNREHIQYTIYPYAEMLERELYNQNIRSTLKEQMKEKAESDRTEQEMKNLECRIVIRRDREDLEEEKQRQKQRARSLVRVTTRNKELMENKWEYEQWNRTHQWHVDRAILADDPINWSKTMT